MKAPQADLLLPDISSRVMSTRRQCGVFQAQRILKISRVVSDLVRAEAFYQDTLGFCTIARGRSDQTMIALIAAPNTIAEEVVMRLGAQEIALVQFAVRGRIYPRASRSDDLWFQHLAIVVSDMDDAYTHLCSFAGWRPISKAGPQQLPPSNGGVRAFKFRDPDGHPLELIWLPFGQGRSEWHEQPVAMQFLGIDHSALSVNSTLRSLSFYRALGFHVSKRSLNRGNAQSRLDGISNARLRVTSLRPACVEGPGLELLCYQPTGRASVMNLPNDLVTDWLTIATSQLPDKSPLVMKDPDGHRLYLVEDEG